MSNSEPKAWRLKLFPFCSLQKLLLCMLHTVLTAEREQSWKAWWHLAWKKKALRNSEWQNHMEITWKSHESSFRLDVGSILLSLAPLEPMLPFPLQQHVTIAFRHMAIAEQLSKHIDELKHPRLLVQAPFFRLMWLKMKPSTFMAIKAPLRNWCFSSLWERFLFFIESTNCTVTVIFLKADFQPSQRGCWWNQQFLSFPMHFLCFFFHWRIANLQVTKGHQLSPEAIDALAEAQLREVAIGDWVWFSTWEKKTKRRLVVVWNIV